MSEWTDIGEQLRKARESKGLDLRDVAHSTRIPLATLRALEESDYSVFPSPTYARSFLSQYSDYLDVDAHEWVDAFETGDVLSNVNDHGYLQEHNEHIGDHSAEPARGNRSHGSPARGEEKPSGGGSSILQTGTVFFVTALLIGGGIYAYKKYEPMITGDSGSPASDANAEERAKKPTAADADKNQPTPADPATTAATATRPPKAQPAPEDTTASRPPLPAAPVEPVAPAPPKPRTGPPPKAMVIDEDDE